MRPVTILFFLCILISSISISQHERFYHIPDSLKYKTKQELTQLYFNSVKDSSLAWIYAVTYLNKAIDKEDSLGVVRAYAYMENISEQRFKEAYYDSVIKITKNWYHKNYPAIAYIKKAKYYLDLYKVKKALENFLIADSLAVVRNNIRQLQSVRVNIAYIKNNIGEHQDALRLFNGYKNFYANELIKSDSKNNREEYMNVLFDIADSHNRMMNLDSSIRTSVQGIRMSLKYNDSIRYPLFILTAGMTRYYEGAFSEAIDSLNKACRMLSYGINHKGNRLVAQLFLGKSYLDLGNKNKAIEVFKQLDIALEDKIYFFIELREIYEILINHFNKESNIEKEIYYVKRLIQLDSILYNDHTYLIKKINKSFDTPKLIEKKEFLIEQLKKEDKVSNRKIYFLIIVCGLVVAFFIRENIQKKIYKERFDKIMSDSMGLKNIDFKDKNYKSNVRYEKSIPKNIKNKINEDLLILEKELFYLKNTVTLNSLAKQLKTNSNYLSRYINEYKGVNFNTYVNNLRIDYVLKKIKIDSKFRKYSMLGIAQEAGFNTALSFSKAFFKRTGIYPSFFIKKLEKEFPIIN